MGADASTAPLGSSKSKKQVPIFHQILIVLHGSRKSGKTSLLRRMNGLNIQPQYTPTKCMQASEIIWHPICMPDESIKIIVWDVVDKAIDQTPQAQRTKQLPDASNVDTFSRADGIIVLYDPRDEDSIKYARSILDQAPQSKPTLIVMNFADSFEKAPSVPPLMEPYTNSFFHLTASMKTNQGLAEIANWLDLPMNVSLSKIYELHLKQSEEKLNNLLKEFNLTGFNEEQEQSTQLKGKENPKDFWSNENDDNADTFGPNEVSADFFMDDDENDLKAKQNLEKLKQKLNLTELDEEEDNDEELKLRMAKKKSKILSKHAPGNNINQSNKTIKQTQIQNQDDNEYSDNEYDKEDGSSKPLQQVSMPQISFDIPVVAENDNDFFEDDKDGRKDSEDLKNDDVDNKLEELKKKLKLEIPKEEEDEEEKPKVKKSKILPKVKPPQIIIKPAQPKPQQQQAQTEISSQNSLSKETENEKNNNIEKENAPKIEIPTISNEKDSFFSGSGNDDFNDINNEAKNDSKVEESAKTDNITMPSFDNAEKESENTNISQPNKNEDEIHKEEPSISIPTISDVTFPSFGNDDFFGDDDDKEDKLPISAMTNEEEEDKINKIEKKSKILPKKENTAIQQKSDSIATTKVTDNTNLTNQPANPETDSKQISNITLPSFGDDSNFFSDENKNENDTKSKEPTFTLPSFGDENKNEDKIENKKSKPPTFDDDSTEVISNKKANDTSFTLPSFGDDSSLFSDENKKDKEETEIKTKEIPTLPSFNDDDNQDQQNQKLPTITLPSFEDSSNFFSDENNKEKEETKSNETPNISDNNQKLPTITLPSFEDSSNFFSDEEAKTKEIPTISENNQKIPDITLPSFGDDSNFFSDKNEKEDESKTSKEATFTLPSLDVNIDADGSKSSNFFNDDENSNETEPNHEKPETLPDESEINNTQKKKKSLILPKQTNKVNFSPSLSSSPKTDTSENPSSNQSELNFDSFDMKNELDEKVESNDSFFTEKSSSKQQPNKQSIEDLPPPPPIDFSNSFLSENQKEKSSEIKNDKNQNQESDLDILNAIRRQEAERAEKARQNAALLEAAAAANATTTVAASSSTPDSYSSSVATNSSQFQETASPVSVSVLSSMAGDYEAFDDSPQPTATKEKRHRKHGSSHRSHRHKSGRRGKTEENENEGGENEGQQQNDDSYLSFD